MLIISMRNLAYCENQYFAGTLFSRCVFLCLHIWFVIDGGVTTGISADYTSPCSLLPSRIKQSEISTHGSKIFHLQNMDPFTAFDIEGLNFASETTHFRRNLFSVLVKSASISTYNCETPGFHLVKVVFSCQFVCEQLSYDFEKYFPWYVCTVCILFPVS